MDEVRDIDKKYMKRCLELAEKGAGYVSPNPKVGAVVVKGTEIIAEGWHRIFGGPHAEVHALSSITPEQLQDSVLYLNLEPCCFTGKTPPCTELILKKRVQRLVVGMIDPNPKVNCNGIELLRRNGVEVKVGALEKKCRQINRAYIKHITTGIPEVILKTAHTLDGRIATGTGDSRWITGKTARTFTHRLRAHSGAILVGSGTIIADDPLLTVRHVKGPNPLRVALDSRLRTSPNAKVYADQDEIPTILFTADYHPQEKIARFEEIGVKVVPLPAGDNGRPPLKEVLKHLGNLGVNSLLVEGGAAVFTSFIREKLVDRKIAVIAPKLIGGDGLPVFSSLGIETMSEVESWKFHQVKRLGGDVLLEIILKEY